MPRIPRSLLLAGALLLGACTGLTGADGTDDFQPEPPRPLERPAPNHNRFVGYFSGGGTLPDGRALQFELVADPAAFASGRVTVGGATSDFTFIPYDLKFGTLQLGNQVAIVLPDGSTVEWYGVPTRSGYTQLGHRTAGGATKRFDVSLKRSTEPLGDSSQVSLREPSADCNATLAPATFEYVESRYDVAEAYVGSFSAHGQLTATVHSRRFAFVMRDIERHATQHHVFIGEGVSFPNEDAQLGYYEDAPDGTIRKWSAVSGRLVFDAVDGTGASRADYETNGKVTFHLENVRMEADNSSSDPRFTGAKGSFTLEYSGTSLKGLKRYSRG